jgi:hypothetical protein
MGLICYPGETIPSMTAYFQQVLTTTTISLDIAAGQSTYAVNLPPGEYVAYAWLPGFSQGGAYALTVECGQNPDCEPYNLIPFDVTAGGATNGVDICNWQAQPGDVPLPPAASPTPTGEP